MYSLHMKQRISINFTFWFGLVMGLAFVFSPVAAQVVVRQLQDGWFFRATDGGDWLPVQIPGNVHTDLLRHQKIGDPYQGQNERVQSFIGESSWEYRLPLVLTSDERKCRHQVIRFEGLDTYADVFLNDSLVLQTHNMFRTWEVDLSGFLFGGHDTLRVVLHSPLKQARKLAAARGYKLPADNDAGEEPLSVYVRKAGYHFGWDWGPRTVTAGIWKPVSVCTWNDLRITDFAVRTTRIQSHTASLKAELELQGTRTEVFDMELKVDGQSVLREPVQVPQGSGKHNFTFSIPNPQRWWPQGAGAQKRYHIEVLFSSKGVEVARAERKIGLREIRLVQAQDAVGTGFLFEVNGRRIFMKGCNYIPPDHFLSRAQDKKMSLLRDMQAVNMNMVRVWGGGVYEDDSFYDACDSLGILVWQDLMFAGGMYPLDDEYFLQEVMLEVQEQAKRLRNHPCLALWCGNNEIEVAWHNWGWQAKYGLDAEQSERLWKAYQQFFNHIAPDLIRSRMPDANYVSTSPLSNWGHPDRYNSGSMHDWSVWHGGYPIDSLRARAPRFAVEYGFQSYPDPATLSSVALPSDLQWGSEWMQHRQKSYKGNQPILDEINRLLGEPTDFADFCWKSQWVQAKALENAIETHRLSQPRCMGTLYWQLNDCWQGPSWSSIDYEGRWKAAHHALRRLYAPVLLDVDCTDSKVVVRGVTDGQEAVQGTLRISLRDVHGKVLKQAEREASLQPDSAVVLAKLPLRSWKRLIKPHKVFLHVEWMKQGHRIAEDSHFFVAPKDLQVPTRNIDWEVVRTEEGWMLNLQSEGLALNVRLESTLPGMVFSHNFMDLLPGRTYSVTLKGADSNTKEEVETAIRVH